MSKSKYYRKVKKLSILFYTSKKKLYKIVTNNLLKTVTEITKHSPENSEIRVNTISNNKITANKGVSAI